MLRCEGSILGGKSLLFCGKDENLEIIRRVFILNFDGTGLWMNVLFAGAHIGAFHP